MEKRSTCLGSGAFAVAAIAILIVAIAAVALPSAHSLFTREFSHREQTLARHVDEGIGATVERLDPATARSLGVPPGTAGLVVTSIASGGPAARAGIQTGDVIVEMERPVESMKDLAAGLRKTDNVLTVRLNRHGRSVIALLPVGQPAAKPARFEEEE